MMKDCYYNEDQSQNNTDAVKWLQHCGISFLFELHFFVFSITSSKRIQRGLTYTQYYYLRVLKLNCCIPDNWLSLDLSGKVYWKAAFSKFLLSLFFFFLSNVLVICAEVFHKPVHCCCVADVWVERDIS